MIVGRNLETQELLTALHSSRPEFVVVYGRRRVGKTYLIDTVYRDYIAFRHAGLPPMKGTPKKKLQRQLSAFAMSLAHCGVDVPSSGFDSWTKAFLALECYLDRFPSNQRVVIFLDELPWMDTTSSLFLDAFGLFWNNYLCFHDNMLLAVTGSASSWILDHLVDNNEGFYRRVTHHILLKPFSLDDCSRLLQSNEVHLSTYEVAQIYMAFGGIPFYLNFFMPGESVAQGIDRILFGAGAPLYEEFTSLFSSQFASPDTYESIVRILAKKNMGFSAEEIAEAMKLKPSGSFYDMLRALQRSCIIEQYSLFGQNKRETRFKLADPFCFFYLKQVEPHRDETHYWMNHVSSQSASTHYDYGFELLCFNHVEQIKKALGIGGISSFCYPFLGSVDGTKAQLDLVLRRQDNVVNLIEVKWRNNEYAMDKEEHLKMEHRKEVLSASLKKRESIQPVLMTTFGLKAGDYRSDFSRVLTLEDLLG
ncbi:MAG: ATP-binding protein [Bacilli bacterium]|nr:ATP-binding protein [Bacilli bacterium]